MLATVDKRPSDLPVIGMDLDSTIAAYDETALLVMRQVSPTPEKCTLENWISWELEKCFDEESCVALVAAMNTPQFWLSIDAIAGAGKALAQLMRHHQIHIVTTRPLEFTDLTRYWCVMYEIPFDNITVVESRAAKLDVAREAGFVAFVDDNQETAEAMRDQGLVAGQLAWPWNHPAPGVVRCETWPELSIALAQEIKLKHSDFRLF